VLTTWPDLDASAVPGPTTISFQIQKKRGSSALHSCRAAKEQISSRIDAVPATGAGQDGENLRSLATALIANEQAVFRLDFRQFRCRGNAKAGVNGLLLNRPSANRGNLWRERLS
jgi:hypothetical protein